MPVENNRYRWHLNCHNQKQKTKAAKARARIMGRAVMLLFRELIKELAAHKQGYNSTVDPELEL